MADFTSSFWNWFIIIPTVGGIIACFLLIRWLGGGKLPAGEDAKSMGHVWDEDLEELNNLLVSETKTHDSEMERNLWRTIQSFAELFLQLEENKLYIDDISGSNFVLNENFQAHLVDLDSLKNEFEEKKCKTHEDCVSAEDYRNHVCSNQLRIFIMT